MSSPAEQYAASRRRAADDRSALGEFRGLYDFELDEFQLEACRALEEGAGVLVAAPTGAGKTTMVKLLMRFYDVNSGAILIDDHNIQDLTRGDLRDVFGMVLQDAWLYNDTIMKTSAMAARMQLKKKLLQAGITRVEQ